MRIFGAVRIRGPLTVLLTRLASVAVVYTLLRFAFVLLNKGEFPAVPFGTFVMGIRFDLSAIAWVNLPWALLSIAAVSERGRWAQVKRWLFLIGNAAALFFACTDLEYYRFTLKRSTADLFGIMAGGGDTLSLAPVFVRDFWYVVLIYVACVWALAWAYGRAARLSSGEPLPVWRRVAWRAVAVAIIAVASRGGLQLIPLNVLNAADHAEPEHVPVVLNTPFTMLMSLGKPVLPEKVFLPQEEADRLWPVEHAYAQGPLHGIAARALTGDSGTAHQRPNVVVIILESFSSVYSGRLSGGAGYMPFLDSLMGEGLCFSRAYANGRRSVDGIPAILASMPELMDEAFVHSPYAQSRFTSLAGVLRAEGYATSFFHGGRNGTMGFDAFSRSAGFDRYIGLNEYPGPESDHDGTWGIRDKPFLRHFIDRLGREPEPFMGTVFTLSSHHPYELPDGDAQRFAGGTHPIHPALRYADDALRGFFREAARQPWFSRTLFVVTADHTADIERTGQHYSAAVDYWVPLVYYMPGALEPAVVDHVTQQIDVMPTVLDLLGHTGRFFSFGSSAVRRERQPLAIIRVMGGYMAMHDGGVLHFKGDPQRMKGVDLRDSTVATMHAAVQQFNRRMRMNQLTVP